MKKINLIIFTLFIGITFFICEDVFAKTCNYNFSGYKDDTIYWTVDSTSGKANQKKSYGNMHDSLGEDVKNWSSGDYYYGTQSGGCPKYLIQSRGWEGFILGAINNKLYVSDEKNLMKILNMSGVQNSSGQDRAVYVLQLANRDVDNNVATTCVYSGDGQTVEFLGITAADTITIELYYDKNGYLSDHKSDKETNWFDMGNISYTVYQTQLLSGACNASLAICPDNTNSGDRGVTAYRAYISAGDSLREDTTFKESDICTVLKYTDGSNESGEEPTLTESCKVYNEYYTEAFKAANNYSECMKNNYGNCNKFLSQFYDIESKTEAYCRAVYSTIYYGDSCFNTCAKYKDQQFVELRVINGIDIVEPGTNSCSLSERMVNWIMKIVRWIRYLVPILLIVLSIMDFIKAVASDSDDEMKKVGGKFVKRLIVAALIFLIPLILEFLLGIFDIGTNDYCL